MAKQGMADKMMAYGTKTGERMRAGKKITLQKLKRRK